MTNNVNSQLKSINAKILNVEKHYGIDSPITQRIYDTLERAYGIKGITRFRKYDIHKVTFSQELMIEHAFEVINLSKYTSAAGRKEIRNKWETSFNQSRQHWSDAQIGRAMDIFENSVSWERIRELVGEYGSDRVLEILTMANDNSNDIQQLDDFIDAYLKNTDYSSVHDDINKELMDFMSENIEGRQIYIDVLRDT